ncbi:hypothetical protein L2E82_09806 [Cichorium intybus]|uniref:Uncharacterized protein n=1 Tax=Cichorium intybus TaxID=13427 RepID=A0ACB9G9V3_CICIN|nr:hypothetical protein L2E82_09806 [Cichorium intybus]
MGSSWTDGNVVPYMFFNFSKNTSVEKLWSLFRRFGNVVDIYIARKTLRNGKEFGFVRFSNENVPSRLEAELNGNDLSDNNSINSLKEEEASEGDDEMFVQDEEGQQSLKSTSIDKVIKNSTRPEFEDNKVGNEEKSNYYEEEHIMGKRNKSQEFKSQVGACGVEDPGRDNGKNELKEEVGRSQQSGCGSKEFEAQEESNVKGVNSVSPANTSIGSMQKGAQFGKSLGVASKTEPFRSDLLSAPSKSNNVEVSEENSTKKQQYHGLNLQENDANRNFSIWDGGMSMRLFKKMLGHGIEIGGKGFGR